MSSIMREDWIEVEIQEVCLSSKGKKPPILENKISEKINVPYINIKAFEKGIIDEYTDGNKCNLCEDGDLLMVWDGARAGLSGKAKKGAVGSTLMKIEEVKGIEKQYLSYFLLSLYTKINTNPRGVGIPHVEPRILWYSKLLLVSSPIQRAIVSKIEALFSDLDNGIANFKKAQEQLKIYRQAVLKKAFEGELTKEWREKQSNLPNAEQLLKQIKEERQNYYDQQIEVWKKAVKGWEKNGKKYRKPIRPVKLIDIKIDTDNSFSSINWLMIEMGNIAELIDPQPSHRTPPIDENGIPFISTANFNKETGEIDFAGARKVSKEVLNDQISLFNLIEGDFIVGKIGTVGKPFVIPSKRFFTLSANLVLVQPIRKICSSKYLLNLVKSNYIQSQFRDGANSTTQAAFGIQKFRLLSIPLPSLQEQTQIVQEIESRLSVCEKVEQSLNESILKAEALRQSILKKAFEGRLLNKAEIEQCKKEADYEPASELLKKIKAEKLAILRQAQDDKKIITKKKSKK